jgi:hypothetical protein
LFLVTPREKAEQEDEQVDEVQIERKSAHDAHLHQAIAVLLEFGQICHFLDALGIVGGQACENQHADDADNPTQRTTGEEDVDNAGNHQTNQAHHQERAEARQINFGGETDDRHHTKQACRREESIGECHRLSRGNQTKTMSDKVKPIDAAYKKKRTKATLAEMRLIAQPKASTKAN